MKLHILLLVFTIACIPALLNAEVLGPCGTDDSQKPAVAASAVAATVGSAQVQRLLLPGEKAPNFELTALVRDKVKRIKLSDYDGKWRVVCFYPADFTFV